MAIKFLSGQTITGSITVSANVQAATFNSLAINTTGVNNVANQIVRTESNGYANFGWINSVSGNHTGSITRITASNDAYLRYVTPAQFRTGVTDGFYAPSSTVSGVTSVSAGNGLAASTNPIISTGTLSTVHLPSFDTRSTNPDPEDNNNTIRFDFKSNSTNGLSDGGGYNGQMTWRSYGGGSDLSGGYPIRLAYTANGNLWRQMGTSATSWGAWNKFAIGTGTTAQYIRGDGSIVNFPTITTGTVTSVATGSGLTGGTITTTGTLSLNRPDTQLGAVLATYGTTAGNSGRIRCTAPFNTNSSKMFSIEITIYTSYTQHNYVVSAYMYSTTNQWYSPKAIYTTTGTASPDIIVGRDSNGKAYISIANGNYTGVLVHNMTRGYTTSLADTYDPWTISITGGTENSVAVSTSQIWTTANLSAATLPGGPFLPLAGGTVTGSTDFTATTYPLDVYGIGSTAGSTAAGLGIYGSSTAGAIMHFHRPNAYAVNFGLDSDNVLRIGGWSAAANRWTLDVASGNNTIAGTVTAPTFIGNLTGNASGTASGENLNTVTGRGNSSAGSIVVNGICSATTSVNSPIFYDSDNTGYYGNFSSNSNINSLTTAGSINANASINLKDRIALPASGLSSVSGRPAYNIYQEGGAWTYPYPDLCLAMHTGIKLGANASYNGIRFYTDYDMSGQVMAVNDSSSPIGAGHVYVNQILQAGSSLRAPIFYDSTNTTYYTRPATSSNINSLYTAGLVQVGSGGSGNLYIGNSGTTQKLRFSIASGSATYFDMDGGDIQWRQNNGVSTRYWFYMTTANMTISGTLTQLSDLRLKENIVEIGDCISKVKAMRGIYYNRTDFNTEVTKVGVIAQEVEKVLPELVLHNEEGQKSVAYAELSAVLINAIKEQQVIIDDLKSRIETLEL